MIRIGVALGSNSEPSGICVVERDQRLVLRRQSPGALEIFRAMAVKFQGASEESPARSEDDETERHELHFAVRFLQRLPSGTRLTEVVRRLKEVVAGIHRRSEDSVLVYLDVTGKGEPALRLFREEVRDSAIIPVYFNMATRESKKRERLSWVRRLWFLSSRFYWSAIGYISPGARTSKPWRRT